MDTILGSDIQFRGKLSFKDKLMIKGRFRGQIATNGELHIASGADVEADIEAGSLAVQGRVRGNVVAKKRIYLLTNGKLHGDIRTPDLQVESGARFTGGCVME